MIGQTLSHYRITAALGAGGMGEVYRATDSNLGRDVAIKVLPPEVAHDAERLARFRREAHLLAALNHPNVAAIYGLEEADGKPFLALELVEGEDLKQRLARGAIPVDEALDIAEQIALALEEARALPRPGFTGGTWSDAGTIVFACGGVSASLYRVPAAGGEATPLTSLDPSRGETSHHWPQFLPDGQHLLFSVFGQQEANTGLFATSLEAAAEKQRILPDGTRFVYANPERLLTVRDGVLSAQPFDPRRLEVAGQAAPIASSVATWTVVPGWGWFSASATGRLAWLSGARASAIKLAWLDRGGKALGFLGEPAKYGQIALAPDGRRVAAEIEDPKTGFDLWLIDVARNVASRLTTDPADEREPVWSPDGQELVFSSDASGDENLLRKQLQGSEPATPLAGGIGATPGERDIPENWSRAGNTLLYMTLGKDRTFWAFPMDGKGKPERLVAGLFNLDEPHVSPDGRWLAYVSTESGRFEVYVEPFRRRGEKLWVSTSGGGQPRWRGDGKELLYLSLDGGIASVSVREGATGLELGIPTTLVPADRLPAIVRRMDYDDWDVTPDGQRFLVKLAATPTERQRIHVLLNWTSLVAR